MSRYVDDSPVVVDPITSQDINDAREDHDQELYEAMLDSVEDNYLHKLELGLIYEMPNSLVIHNEAVALLRGMADEH